MALEKLPTHVDQCRFADVVSDAFEGELESMTQKTAYVRASGLEAACDVKLT